MTEPSLTVSLAWDRNDQDTVGREVTVPVSTWLRLLTCHVRRAEKERDDRPRHERRPLAYTLARFADGACTCGQQAVYDQDGRRVKAPCPDLGWTPGATARGHRIARNVLAVTGLAIDLDQDASGGPLTPGSALAILERFALQRLVAAIASSHSSRAEEPHYRVVVPLSREVPIADWRRFLPAALAYVGIPPGCPADARHIWYLPSCRPDAEPEATILDGAPLDVDLILATAPTVSVEVPRASRPDRRAPIDVVVPSDEDRLEAIQILAAAWPPVGTRYQRRLELAGALAREDWEQDDVVEFLDTLAAATNGGECTHQVHAQNLRMAGGSSTKHSDGDPVTGWTRLAAATPELAEAVPRVRDVLARRARRENRETLAAILAAGERQELLAAAKQIIRARLAARKQAP